MFSKWNPGWLAQRLELLQVALAARGHSSAPDDATDGGEEKRSLATAARQPLLRSGIKVSRRNTTLTLSPYLPSAPPGVGATLWTMSKQIEGKIK